MMLTYFGRFLGYAIGMPTQIREIDPPSGKPVDMKTSTIDPYSFDMQTTKLGLEGPKTLDIGFKRKSTIYFDDEVSVNAIAQKTDYWRKMRTYIVSELCQYNNRYYEYAGPTRVRIKDTEAFLRLDFSECSFINIKGYTREGRMIDETVSFGQFRRVMEWLDSGFMPYTPQFDLFEGDARYRNF